MFLFLQIKITLKKEIGRLYGVNDYKTKANSGVKSRNGFMKIGRMEAVHAFARFLFASFTI